MKRSRVLISSGYGLALLLILQPLMQTLATLLPTPSYGVRWRLEAFGAVSTALLLPVLGGVVAVGTAVLLSHRRVVRVLAAAAWGAALVIGVATLLFVLDLLQYVGEVDPTLRASYVVSGVTYVVASALQVTFILWLGFAAWRATTHSRRVLRVGVRAGSGRSDGPVQPAAERTLPAPRSDSRDVRAPDDLV